MAISASMVKELRERTGAGMMDCKVALVDAGGNMDNAVELLRKSGQANADKKSGRIAADGCVVITTGDSRAAMIEINSETDFVARDENFIRYAEAVAECVLASDAADVETLAGESLADGRTVEAARTELITKVGENISLRRFVREGGGDYIGTYTHGARIGAIVSLQGGDAELARNIAMHVAATNPVCLDETGVPADTLKRERRLFAEQAEESGKPPAIVEKMVTGRVAKFLQEITLVGQPFVKDSDTTVGNLLAGAGAEVLSFVRYEVGEGIEKKEENFAAVVAQQVAAGKNQSG